jgi:hypothetical protein
MTGRILDHGPVAIPIRATTGQECSYPRTIGFSCVAPAEHPVPGHSFGTLRMAEMLGSEVVVGPVPNRAVSGTGRNTAIKYHGGGVSMEAGPADPPSSSGRASRHSHG